MRMRPTINPLCAVVMLAAVGSATILAQTKPSFADAQKANSQALRQYTWQSRTEIKIKGESKNVKLEQVRYNLDGQIQKTPIGAPPAAAPAPAPSGRGGRLKGKVIEKKKDEFADMMQGLGQLVASYAQLPPDKLQAFTKSATTGPGDGAMQGSMKIQGVDVLLPGDSLTIWVDPGTQMMRRVEIKTIYDKKPASAVAEYASVPNGPTYMGHAALTYPDKNVELTIDNSNHTRAQP